MIQPSPPTLSMLLEIAVSAGSRARTRLRAGMSPSVLAAVSSSVLVCISPVHWTNDGTRGGEENAKTPLLHGQGLPPLFEALSFSYCCAVFFLFVTDLMVFLGWISPDADMPTGVKR